MNFGTMTSDEIVEHLLDNDGLVAYVDLWRFNRKGEEFPEFSWDEMARHIWSLTRQHWQPTPDYLEGVYNMQAARVAA